MLKHIKDLVSLRLRSAPEKPEKEETSMQCSGGSSRSPGHDDVSGAVITTKRSLWDRVPRDIRLELIPIASTALLIQAGASTAEAVVRLRNGVPYGQPIGPQPVNDLTGFFILLNFVVVFWFGYQVLKSAIAKGGDLSLNARLIGLASAFVTSLELYSYALKTGQPVRLVYAIVVLFYVFFVPFALMRESELPAIVSDDTAAERRRTAVQALLGIELVAHALVPCVAAVIIGSVYFSVLNDGIAIGGTTVLPSIVRDWLGVETRTAFWGFSPGILGIAWLQAVILTAEPRASVPEMVRFGLDRTGRYIIGVATIAINIMLALLLVSDASVAGVSSGAAAGSAKIAKVILAVTATAAFLCAFAAARAVEHRAKEFHIGLLWLLQGGLFAIAGSAVGWTLIMLRTWLGDQSVLLWNLIWMHALGFALVYWAGTLASNLLRRRLSHVPAIVGSRSEITRASSSNG